MDMEDQHYSKEHMSAGLLQKEWAHHECDVSRDVEPSFTPASLMVRWKGSTATQLDISAWRAVL
jgi:hypothetical protein